MSRSDPVAVLANMITASRRHRSTVGAKIKQGVLMAAVREWRDASTAFLAAPPFSGEQTKALDRKTSAENKLLEAAREIE